MIIGTGLQVGLGAMYIILPGVVPAFFAGGTSGIFGNATGGWKGAILGPFIMGIVLAFGTGWLIPFTGDLYKTGATFGDPFYATVGLAFAKWGELVGKGGVVGIIALVVAVALVLYVFISGRNYKEIEGEEIEGEAKQ